MSLSEEKLSELKNFLLDKNSNEYLDYESFLLSGQARRPEDEFIDRHLSRDFWRSLGFDGSEIRAQQLAGQRGFVERGLNIEGKKIAVEVKKPYAKNRDRVYAHVIDGDDTTEMETQIGPYLSNHDFVIYTNGHSWYFYSKTSYLVWHHFQGNRTEIHPYFAKFSAEEIFQEGTNNIRNILSRSTILETLYSLEQKQNRRAITNEFFSDLRVWIDAIDEALQNAPANTKARTISLINKLIFVRTMEGVGVIPNGFLISLWNPSRGVNRSPVDFIDQIDDQLTDTYDTELFTSKYVQDGLGNPKMDVDGNAINNKARQKNFAYQVLPSEFFSAILMQRDNSNANDTGITQVSINGKLFNIKSLYWWKFESIPADVLGKAYETYLTFKKKKLGIFYTAHQITEILTKFATDEIFDDEIKKLETELRKDSWDKATVEKLIDKITHKTLCDPSCGSGSFLIQICRYVWQKYEKICKIIEDVDSQLQSNQSSVDPSFVEKASLLMFLKAKFRVGEEHVQARIGTLILRHVYGNDKDPDAVETAKLNIWLECLRLAPNAFKKSNLGDKRHVLPNLSLNITNGDSLIGLDTSEVEKSLDEYRDTIKSILGLRRKYAEEFQNTSIAEDARLLRESLQDFVDLEFEKKLDHSVFDDLMKAFGYTNKIELVKKLNPTHWALQHVPTFFDVEGKLKDVVGFDAILGNPPWEILEASTQDFAGSYYNPTHTTKFKELGATEKDNEWKKLLGDPSIEKEWKKLNDEVQLQLEYYQKNKTFVNQTARTNAPQSRGVRPNLAKFFIEKNYGLLKNGGVLGLVLPSDLNTGIGSKGLRQLIFENGELIKFYGFSNKKFIFEELHQQQKFLTILWKKGGNTNKFKSVFDIEDIDKLQNISKDEMIHSIELVKKASPDHLLIPEYKNEIELRIADKVLAFPKLSHGDELIDDTLSFANWKIRFQREFNFTDDRHMFNENGKGHIIYGGKMIHQFTHIFAKPSYWIESTKGEEFLEDKQVNVIKMKYGKIIDKSSTDLHFNYYRLVWRDATGATNIRSLLSAILPPKVLSVATIPYLRPTYFNGTEFEKAISYDTLLFLCGVFNSFVIDYLMRQKIQSHATMSHVLELPIPRYSEKDEYFTEIVQDVGSLVCGEPEFEDLKKDVKIERIASTSDERNAAMARINAKVAKIYGLTENELKYILSKFSDSMSVVVPNQPLKDYTLEEFVKL